MDKINILWASMFGTAEDVANDVFDSTSNKLSANIEINEMNDIDMDSFKSMKNVIFISSTTGQGDIPSNGEEFFDNLSSSDIDLSNINYGICALGDSSHTYFCGGPKKIDKRMEELGANKIAETHTCDGDDEGAREYSIDTIKKLTGN
tara:strand:+ start:4394 stop:4837 length:444 start_codon:yes stop_codon:yes gene_type:complete